MLAALTKAADESADATPAVATDPNTCADCGLVVDHHTWEDGWEGTVYDGRCEECHKKAEENAKDWSSPWGQAEVDFDATDDSDALLGRWPPAQHWPCPATAAGLPCAARVAPIDGKGRAAVASRSIQTGEEIALERAFAFVIKSKHATSSCAHCATQVPEAARAAQEPDSGGGGSAGFAFCSKQCRSAALAGPGALFFAHVGQLAEVATACSVDVDLLRILLRCAFCPHSQSKRILPPQPVQAQHADTTLGHVSCLQGALRSCAAHRQPAAPW